MSWRTLLVLGGIGSGRSGYAESLLTGDRGGGGAGDPSSGGAGDPSSGGAGDPSSGGPGDPSSEAAAAARVVTAGPGDDLARLQSVLAEAKPDETLLVQDLADWLPARAGETAPQALAESVRACPAARLVLVSSEVGLSLPPSAATSRNRALALGALNQALADAADAVVLVVAGQPVRLKGTGPVAAAHRPVPARATPASVPSGKPPDLSDLKGLPTPDEEARAAATDRLAALGTMQLGALARIVGFAAATQGNAQPAQWRQVRTLVLHGDHAGEAAAGAPGSARRATELREGTSPLAQLAGQAGAAVQVVEVAAAAAMEDGPAMTDEAAEHAMAAGWRLAEQAADEGIELIVLGSIGAGAETAAAAVTAVLAANAEPAGLLARVRTPEGRIDDQAWIRRCAAVRDAVHRVRSATRTTARPVLAELGGPDLATATGVILGAAARRTPVMLDGPVGAVAALVARGLAAPSRHWCLLPDHHRHPTVVRASDVLNLTPLLDLQLDLGEGAASLAALPLLRTALTLAADSGPTHSS